MAYMIYERRKKTNGWAIFYLALGLIGTCGVHRLYMGKTVSGMVMLITIGGLFIWQIVDAFLPLSMVRDHNDAVIDEIRFLCGEPFPKVLDELQRLHGYR